MGDAGLTKDLSTPICGTPVPETLHRECQCGVAQDVGFLLVCDDYSDDDGDCLICGHAEVCHEHK
jgi:hypothetical protein